MERKTNELTLRELTMEELKVIHKKHMKRDFPPSELRPFRSMNSLYQQGRYHAYGLFAGQKLVAYGCFASLSWKGIRCALFDYLAVLPEYRDSGVGSRFLAMLPQVLEEFDCVFGEVENPEKTEDAAEQMTRQRRMEFYARAGYLDTGVNVRLFGVDYRLMEVPLHGGHSGETLRTLYREMYRSFLPEPVFRAMVSVE